MPELPDICGYLAAFRAHVVGQTLRSMVVKSPFLLRTFDPPLETLFGRELLAVDRIGKRLVLEFSDGLSLVIHLMIAGRLHLRPRGKRPASRVDLASLEFDHLTLMLTEASQKKRAAMHVIQGSDGLELFRRGGIDVLEASPETFRAFVSRENHTLKRALTDPRLVDGIGNAYSDEILHEAGLSPLQWTDRLDDEQWQRLHEACGNVLRAWITKSVEQACKSWPEKVTAFRPEMSVHGKFGKPCPKCQTTIQRVRYADNETNYCPRCQTGGKLLADRSLSRLLKDDWPKTIDDWELGQSSREP